MKKIILIFCFIPLFTYAQDTTQSNPDSSTSVWKKGGVASLTISQSSFNNWAAGGEDNINIASLMSLFAHRATLKSNWENNLDMGYGLQKINNGDFRKSEDKIELNSKYGLKINRKLNYSLLFNARSQFTDGFIYTDTSKIFLASFLSPGYFTLSAGLDYRPSDQFSVFFSPITGKITTVLDNALAAKGAFGVDSGKNIRFELGSLASIKYETDLNSNILIKSKLDLFGNYKDLQAIDISWENLVAFQITKLLAATLTTNLLYDQDVLIPKQKEIGSGLFITENKPRTQFKQVFALGITYKF